MTNKNKGILYLALGSILFSSKAVLIKLAYRDTDIDALGLLFLRFGLSLPLFLIIGGIRYKKGHFAKVSSKQVLIIFCLSLLGYYIASLFDFMGLEYISAGLERVILFSYPTFVMIFSYFFFQHTISQRGVFSLLLTYLGIFIIVINPQILEGKDFIKGAGFILISAITYAIYLSIGSEFIKKIGSVNFNTLALAGSCVFVIAHFLVVKKIDLSMFNSTECGYGMILAVFCTVIPTYLSMEGIKLMGANEGSIVSSIGPVATAILGYYFLNETLGLQEIGGSLLVIIGVLLLSKK
ncbi:MAG: DMT family transporter, partial [Leadbetterella sp.]